MSLPSVACFRQMDIIDQLTALYEAILQISGGGSFSPDQILGLQAWYKDEGIVVGEENQVSQWNDSSGNGNTLNANPGLSNAVFDQASLNGRNTVQFTENTCLLERGAALMTGTAATMFIVANRNSAASGGGWYTARPPQQPNRHPDSSNDIQDAFFSTTLKSCGAQVIVIDDNWRILCIRSRDLEYRMELDGQLQFSTNTNTFDLGQDFILGAGEYDGVTPDAVFQGNIAEVIIYNAYLSENQGDAVLTYLRNRFNL